MSNKEIGQFFSGSKVANLLVLAADLADVDSIYAIDPMVGQADMLKALWRGGAHAERLYGIDIDGKAVETASSRIEGGHFLKCDALSKEAAALYNMHRWDLVITNPPYVRYQGLDKLYGDNAVEEIRKRLIETIDELDIAGSKLPYFEGATSYSGLSDLAVPCWILCACLVKPGGKLAMVLPDAWLKREYAKPIYDILNADFTVDRIVIDESRTWFPHAQVKTNLLIATKRDDENTRTDNTRVHCIGLSKWATNNRSLTGMLTYKGKTGDEAFADLCQSEAEISSGLAWTRYESLSSVRPSSFIQINRRMASLSDWGLSVGQGLRTGANGFFYLLEDENGLVSNSIWTDCAGLEPAVAAHLPLLPALRYQDELGNAYTIEARGAGHRLLYLDSPIEENPVTSKRTLMNLRKYISYCERHEVIQSGRRQYIPGLSAVRTNGPLSRVVGKDRYWYMLPMLKDRHRPNLVIPRINGGVVRAYQLAGDRQIVADANFSTVWVNDGNLKTSHAALALLNSTYVRLDLERNCSVLGGGALKCEAVSLRKMGLPEPKGELREALQRYGAEFATVRSIDEAAVIQNGVDSVIARAVTGGERAEELLVRWRDELDIRLKLRSE